MSDEPSHIALAQESRDKFERYVVALTFSILGLAITTSRPSTSIVAGSLELLAWACLLVSGLVGLSRLERAPAIHETYYYRELVGETQRTVHALHQQVLRAVANLGTSMPTPRAVEQVDRKMDELAAEVEKGLQSSARRYRIHRVLLLAGVFALVFARAYVPAIHLGEMIRQRLGH